MSTEKEYTSRDKMRAIIEDNSALLMCLSRFDIPLGFGDSTIEKVCKAQNVDCDTFLAVANYISYQRKGNYEISLDSLMDYLKNAHTYFLEFQLPSIRRKLIEAINVRDEDNVSTLILKFFDNYVGEVDNHMKYENDNVFAYVNGLLNNEIGKNFSLSGYSSHHNGISTTLKELKDIIIRYYPQRNKNLINSVLFDIITCEQDLKSHCDIEDNLFLPEVEKLEEAVKLHVHNVAKKEKQETSQEAKIEALSEREKDIIKCVAKGMANKEIADELCLSVHTVTTHRRNISSKLQIHSPAGLTIFAILNNLVQLDEVKHLR